MTPVTQRTLSSLSLRRGAHRATRRARTTLIAAIALVGAVGCGGDSTGPGSGIAGKYNIVSVTGPQGTDNSAPFVLINQSVQGTLFRAEIASGFVTLGPAPGNRYSGDATINFYANNIFVGNDDSFGGFNSSGGVYTVSGTTITFTPDDQSQSPTTATLSGNTLTFTESEDDPTLGHIEVTIVLRK